MENIFTFFLDIFINLWETISQIWVTITNVISKVIQFIIPLVEQLITWLGSAANVIITLFNNIIKFFGGGA